MAESSKEIIIELVREILKNGSVIPTEHAWERMSERNYSFADVKYILKNGTLIEIALHENQYRYTFSGNDIDGCPGEVVIEVRESTSKIIVITVKGGV